MKQGRFTRVFGLITALALFAGCLQMTAAAKTVQERLLMAWDGVSRTGSLYPTLNKASTLETDKYSTGFFFGTNKTKAVKDEILTLETERYRILPEGTSSNQTRNVYYEKEIPNFEEKYLTFDFAALAGYSYLTEQPKIGFSAIEAKDTPKTEVMYLNLSDYVDLNKAKNNKETFYQVSIPVADFFAKGEFKALNGSKATEIDKNKINGITVACGMKTDALSGQKAFAINNLAITSVETGANYRLLNSEATGTDYSALFDDNYVAPNYVLNKGISAYDFTGAAKNGTACLRFNIKGGTTEERIYCGLANKLVREIDFENDALQFWYQPKLERANTKIGLLCQGTVNQTNPSQKDKVAMLSISLTDYLGLTGADYSAGEWIPVTIPLKYFIDNGEFDKFLSEDVMFSKHTLTGIIFEYSTEDIPESDTPLAYIDDLKFVNSVKPAEDLEYYTNGNSVTLSWKNDSERAKEYDIYRGNDLIGTVKGSCTFTDTPSDTDAEVYSVRSKGEGMKSVVTSAEVSFDVNYAANFTQNAEEKVQKVTLVKGGDKAFVSWDGSENEYLIYKNGEAYAAATGHSFKDSSYTDGDVYTVAAADSKTNTLYAATAVSVTKDSGYGSIISELAFENDSNGYPDTLTGKVYNYSGEAKPAVLYVAHYEYSDGNTGKLVSIEKTNTTLAQGTDEVSHKLDYVKGLSGSYAVKAYVFTGSDEMTPTVSPVTAAYSTAASENAATVTVLSDRQQEIKGWGISPFAISDNEFLKFQNKEDWQEMFDTLYGKMGLTSIRVPFDKDCGDESGNISQEQLNYRVEYIKRAKEYGIDDYIISYWSAPEGMTEKRHDDEDWKTEPLWHLKNGMEEAYCDYIVSCINYLNENGVGLPSGVGFQNEPQNGNNTPIYSIGQYKTVSKLLRQKLDAAGFNNIPITSPETVSYVQLYKYMGGSKNSKADGDSLFNFDYLTEDSEYADSIGVLCTHSYHETSAGAKNADIANFASQAAKFPQKERWMTEFSGNATSQEAVIKSTNVWDADMGTALFTMRILSGDVGWAGMNRWYYWQGYRSHYTLTPDNAPYTMESGRVSPQTVAFGQPGQTVHTTKLYDALRLLFTNVPKGSYVKHADCTDTDFVNESALRSDILAFETPEGNTVVMLVNISENAKTVNFSGLTGTKAHISFVTAESSRVTGIDRSVADGTVADINVPARSIAYVITGE